MVLIDSVKYACATCIKGHRSSTCNHDSRPLIEIKKKGRPVTQCVHCRELRKTKQVHVKCLCEGRPEASTNVPRTVFPTALAATAAPSVGVNTIANTNDNRALAPSGHSCDCKNGGPCECSTPKHTPRQSGNLAVTAAAVSAGGGGSSSGKPPGLTRGHTYHASSLSMSASSMSHDASASHSQSGSKHGSALQRSASHHGGATAVASAGGSSSSHLHSNNHNANGTHHPQPQHHHARHFAPYQVAHHSHHHHARFDIPEDNDSEGTFAGASIAAPDAATFRRHRSSSVSHGELARPFPPPTQVYLNSAAAMSLPDVLAWSPSDISPMAPYNQQLAEAARSTPYLPSSATDMDTWPANSPDDFMRQFGSAGTTVLEEPRLESYPNATGPADFPAAGGPATGGVDMQFAVAGSLPELRFGGEFDQLDSERNAFDYSDNTLAYNSGSSGASSEYDAMMASFLSLPQQSIQAFGSSGPGTSGSSRPPSMTGSGSITSRSSSRASGGLPPTLEMLEMTSVVAAAAAAGMNGVVVDMGSADGAHRGRPPRGFPPIADPFENESSTAIPPFDAYERPLQQRRLSPLNIDSKSNSQSLSHSHSPMSQDSAPSVQQDDGSGTQFPAWPQQSSPVTVSNLNSTAAGGFSPFDGEGFEFSTTGAPILYTGQRGPSLDFDDSAWNPRA